MKVHIPWSTLGEFSAAVLGIKPGRSRTWHYAELSIVFPRLRVLGTHEGRSLTSPTLLVLDAGNAILRKALGPRTRLSADLVLSVEEGPSLCITRLSKPLALPRAAWVNPAFRQGWVPEPHNLGGWVQTGEIGLAAKRLKEWHERVTRNGLAKKPRKPRKKKAIKN